MCGVYAEMFKVGGEPALKGLYTLLYSIWNSSVIPADWKKDLVVNISKGKGNTKDANYRDVSITILSSPV